MTTINNGIEALFYLGIFFVFTITLLSIEKLIFYIIKLIKKKKENESKKTAIHEKFKR